MKRMNSKKMVVVLATAMLLGATPVQAEAGWFSDLFNNKPAATQTKPVAVASKQVQKMAPAKSVYLFTKVDPVSWEAYTRGLSSKTQEVFVPEVFEGDFYAGYSTFAGSPDKPGVHIRYPFGGIDYSISIRAVKGRDEVKYMKTSNKEFGELLNVMVDTPDYTVYYRFPHYNTLASIENNFSNIVKGWRTIVSDDYFLGEINTHKGAIIARGQSPHGQLIAVELVPKQGKKVTQATMEQILGSVEYFWLSEMGQSGIDQNNRVEYAAPFQLKVMYLNPSPYYETNEIGGEGYLYNDFNGQINPLPKSVYGWGSNGGRRTLADRYYTSTGAIVSLYTDGYKHIYYPNGVEHIFDPNGELIK